MDRPEAIETNPVNGKVYGVMTNSNQRTAAQVDAPKPWENNIHAHIIELTKSDDATAITFTIMYPAANGRQNDGGRVVHSLPATD